MKLLTHISIGVLSLIYLYLLNILVPTSIMSMIVALILVSFGSIFPDIDIYLDNAFPKYKIFKNEETGEIEKIRIFRFHRKLLHNFVLILILLFVTGMSFLNIILPSWMFPYILIFSIGVILHILSDATTPLGVVVIKNKRIKGKMRSPNADLVVLTILIILLYVLIVILRS